MFAFDRSGAATAWLEEPFTHHDLDGDGVAELTIQFLGRGTEVATIRYSFDADNDSNPQDNRRDYDFSLNCTGRLAVPEECTVRYALRNGQQTGPSLDWQYARAQAEAGGWRSCRLCWDEIDNNVNPADALERNWERWEGVGGYPMNEGNKRWETDSDCSGRMALYYWPADRRLHLVGAETGYIDLDLDHNGRSEARVTYADRDGDGFFDEWSYDTDADGRPDHIAAPVGAPPELVPLDDYDRFAARYRRWVQEALADDERLIGALHRLLGPGAVSPAEQWWAHERPATFYAAAKLGASPEARRYYLDITREQLFLQAWEAHRTAAWWPAFRAAYEAGNHRGATGILEAGPVGGGRGESSG